MDPRKLRVCYFGTYRESYSRNQIMLEGLRRNGVDVVECHQPLWRGIEDRVRAASGGWWRPAFLLRVGHAYWALLRAHRKVGDYDVMLLGYPGQLDVYLARLLTWARRRPLVLDVFMSLYLIATERGLTPRHRVTARLLHWLEGIALRLPDLLVHDTAEYVGWLRQTYGLQDEHFCLVPTGADDRAFYPQPRSNATPSAFRVLYYGTFIPNHGVEQIIEAARLLQDEPEIAFELIGDGPTRAGAEQLVRQHQLANVAFVGWMDKRSLVQRAGQADLLLGAFGSTPQSLMTVQNKIYEGLAMRAPVLSGDSRTVRAALENQKHICLVPRGDAAALANSILTLKADPVLRQQIADAGYQKFQSEYTPQALGARLIACLREVMEK